MSQVVLDASALVALIKNETGANIVEPLIPIAIMSAVNVAEAIKVLQRKNFSYEEATLSVSTLIGEIIPYGRQEAYLSTDFETAASRYGLSLGDCACLSLGRYKKLPVITADKIWKKTENLLGIEVHPIR